MICLAPVSRSAVAADHQLEVQKLDPSWIQRTSYVPGSKVAVLGMVIQPLIGNPYNGYINPYYWVDEFIPYYMEIMGV